MKNTLRKARKLLRLLAVPAFRTGLRRGVAAATAQTTAAGAEPVPA